VGASLVLLILAAAFCGISLLNFLKTWLVKQLGIDDHND